MNSTVIHCGEGYIEPGSLKLAVEALGCGHIVLFPTETVYGLGVRYGDAEAASRLNCLKGREANQPLTFHLSPEASLEAYTQRLSPLAHRLMARFSPGPLTLILPACKTGQEIGIRVPDHPVFQALSRETGEAILATSANLTGEQPAMEVGAVPPTLRDAAAVILDGGRSRNALASTVVRPCEDRADIIREGAIPATLIGDESGPVTLIVCLGNTCRSPMAAVILSDILEQRLARSRQAQDLPIPAVYSAGTGAFDGAPASRYAVDVARERGLDLTPHVASSLQPHLVHGADFILTISTSSAQVIASAYPEVAARITVLNQQRGGIPDPFGGSLEVYRTCADVLHSSLSALVESTAERFS